MQDLPPFERYNDWGYWTPLRTTDETAGLRLAIVTRPLDAHAPVALKVAPTVAGTVNGRVATALLARLGAQDDRTATGLAVFVVGAHIAKVHAQIDLWIAKGSTRDSGATALDEVGRAGVAAVEARFTRDLDEVSLCFDDPALLSGPCDGLGDWKASDLAAGARPACTAARAIVTGGSKRGACDTERQAALRVRWAIGIASTHDFTAAGASDRNGSCEHVVALTDLIDSLSAESGERVEASFGSNDVEESLTVRDALIVPVSVVVELGEAGGTSVRVRTRTGNEWSQDQAVRAAPNDVGTALDGGAIKEPLKRRPVVGTAVVREHRGEDNWRSSHTCSSRDG